MLWLAAGAGQAVERPMPRPPPEAIAPLPRPDGLRVALPPGPVCGHPAIIGERLPAIDDEGACGIERPVRVRSVAGVALAPPPVIACGTAHTLRTWLEESAKPTFAAEEDALVGLGIAAAYVCRNVNYAEDGELSEHARGHALDIARFETAGGETVSVLTHWGSPEHGELLRRIHEDACGIFATAIGPESDALHADHFHYDIAERRRPHCP